MPEVFNVDWFSEHIPRWSRVLAKRVGKSAKALFVGVHEGRAPHWLVEHLAPNALLTVVDDFKYEECVYFRGEAVLIPPVKTTFDAAMRSLGRRAVPSKTGRPASGPAEVPVIGNLRALVCEDGTFDLVYVDARSSKHVLDALVRVLPMVRPGGIVVVTNNVHGRMHDSVCPRRGIQGFMDAFVTDIKVIEEGFHLFFERRKTPLAETHPCRYEIFDGQESWDPPSCGAKQPRRQAGRDGARSFPAQ